jgi:hypothetical protein
MNNYKRNAMLDLTKYLPLITMIDFHYSDNSPV